MRNQTGAYIGTDDTETALKTAGVAAGIATFGKVSSRAFQDLQFKGLGKRFSRDIFTHIIKSSIIKIRV